LALSERSEFVKFRPSVVGLPGRGLATSFFLFGSFSLWRHKKEKEQHHYQNEFFTFL
jgi:hypothetical protein